MKRFLSGIASVLFSIGWLLPQTSNMDLLIRGGTVIDGTGSEPVIADVGIRGDRIAFVGDARGPSECDKDAGRCGADCCSGFHRSAHSYTGRSQHAATQREPPVPDAGRDDRDYRQRRRGPHFRGRDFRNLAAAGHRNECRSFCRSGNGAAGRDEDVRRSACERTARPDESDRRRGDGRRRDRYVDRVVLRARQLRHDGGSDRTGEDRGSKGRDLRQPYARRELRARSASTF